jgi:hypothetical protein
MSGLRTGDALRGDRITMEGSALSVAAPRSRIHVLNIKLLFVLFLVTLPLANPWVRGDGVGYYAYLRSALIDHDLRFENDYLAANESFLMSRVDAQGHLLPSLYTKTGYVANHFSVGPAILWAPVLVPVHLTVLLARHLGVNVAANGYSHPYLLAMAMTTATYGFLSLFLALRVARKYFPERWALLATVGIWFASSLPIYMYFNPSWSHSFSAFSVSLFLWYWERTRGRRTRGQWAILGLFAGLMGNVYYPNAIVLIFPGMEVLQSLRSTKMASVLFSDLIRKVAVDCGVFFAVFAVSLLPTFISRQIIYGSPFETGYPSLSTWNWTSPVLLKVLFSSDHGMFTWTPVLILATAGIYFLIKRDALLGLSSLLTFLAFYYFIASYSDWDGLSGFGNRFFVSLTPIFILGLTALLSAVSDWLGKPARAMAAAFPVLALLVIWNGAFIFQWGTHMVPARGEISWRTMIHNQFVEVPLRLTHSLRTYFTHREDMMQHIEREDIDQQKKQGTPEN